MLHGLRPSAHDRGVSSAAPRRRALAAALATGVLAASTFAAAGPAAATGKGDPYGKKPYAVGAYVYKKLRPAEAAAWDNSGEQFLVGAWNGREYRPTMTLAEIEAAVGFPVCGAGWGVQQDKAYGGREVFTAPTQQPHYPDFVIGWAEPVDRYAAGKLYEAAHWNLEAVVGTVPPCAPSGTPAPPVTPVPSESPEPEPTTTPEVTPSPVASVEPEPTVEPVPEPSGVPVGGAAPTVSPSAAPSPAVTPSETPTPTVTPPGASEVLAGAPTSTPSPTYTSEVLAAAPSSGRVLAATGSSVGPMLAVAGVLVAGGAGLVVARQRRARQQG